MGYELEAFLGRACDLRRWKAALPATVVCRLAGELHLVPVTGALGRQLLAHTSAASLDEALRRWLASASREADVVHVSGYEFGDQGDDVYRVWSAGAVVLGPTGEFKVADYFRDRMGLDVPHGSFDIGRHRGESAAEKWAARALPEDQLDVSTSAASPPVNGTGR